MPFRDFSDMEALGNEADWARRMGFGGKAAIHPDQVPVIERVFTPAPEEVEWARRVVAAAESGPDGAIAVDGKMVDRPIIEAARRILGRIGEVAQG